MSNSGVLHCILQNTEPISYQSPFCSRFGQALRAAPSYIGLAMEGLKKLYITKIKRMDLETMCVMTLLFEGDEKDVVQHEKKIYEIAAKFGGIPAGRTNGERGYMLTFVIAYIRVSFIIYHIFRA